MPKSNYLLITPDYPPPFVGGSKVWLYGLLENCPDNFDVLTSSLREGCQEVAGPNQTMLRKPWITDSDNPTTKQLLINYLMMPLWLFWRTRRVKYKLVIVNHGVIGVGLVILMARFLNIRILGTALTEEITLSLYGKGLKNIIRRWFFFNCYKKATAFIAVCHFCKRLIVEHVNFPEELITVIPSGITPEKTTSSARKKEAGHTIISVGRLVERKGFHFLLDAVARLKPDIPNIKVHVVGNGPMLPRLQAQIERLNLEDCVELHGLTNDETLAALYSESDLFVLAHTMLENGDTEGCPTVFSEAGSMGLPLIGGINAGSDTAINEGENGFIVDTKDVSILAEKIRLLLLNPRLAQEMGKAAQKKVERDHNPSINGKRLGLFLTHISETK